MLDVAAYLRDGFGHATPLGGGVTHRRVVGVDGRGGQPPDGSDRDSWGAGDRPGPGGRYVRGRDGVRGVDLVEATCGEREEVLDRLLGLRPGGLDPDHVAE